MKISLNWLREFVDTDLDASTLSDLLTTAGVEVEGIHETGVSIPNVVAARIDSFVPHPNADRLSVCQVDDGSETIRQIVCGAKNFKAGDIVPLAQPGAVLPSDFKIKVGKLRGVESQGMLCAADELGLPKGADGLLILPPETEVGTPISFLFPGDTVIDIEITPNRADLISHTGLAREVAALVGKTLRRPSSTPIHLAEVEPLAITLHAPECPAYLGRRISGVRVGHSPEWLRRQLESLGLRSINNIVDITNYVMMELGQPMHAFDAAKVSGGIHVRTAAAGETLLALDGKTYAPGVHDLVIADDHGPLALAGIMGGETSGVSEHTTEIILESACFDPATIRRTSRALGVASDSSYRFERGVDATLAAAAAERAAQLIVELAGGKAGPCITAGALPIFSARVALRNDRCRSIIGESIPDNQIMEILTGFGLIEDGDAWKIPSYRSDLLREIDLIEEVARVVGMASITGKVVARVAHASDADRAFDRAMDLRRTLAGIGFHEARSITLVPETPTGLGCGDVPASEMLQVKNPMLADQVVLRPGLSHGLLKAVQHNANAGAECIRLFEIGRVFSKRTPQETTHLGLVLGGSIAPRSWRSPAGRDADLFDVKSIVADLIGAGVQFAPVTRESFALALEVRLGKKVVGWIGQLWPAEARALDFAKALLCAELDLNALPAAASQRRYKEIPRFPVTSRDIALLAPLELAHERVTAVLAKANEPMLAKVELFDVFTDATGAKLAADKKSLAYSFTYRAPDRTLTADEVNLAHGKLKDRLIKELGVTARE